VAHGLACTPAEVRRCAYAQLVRHAIDRKLTLDLEQARLDDISQSCEHLKTGPPRKLWSYPEPGCGTCE
jgi:hypothetical protein